MIAKFFSKKAMEDKSTLEVGLSKDGYFKIRSISYNDDGKQCQLVDVNLSDEDLFEFIGYLLRIQSKMKKEVKNG